MFPFLKSSWHLLTSTTRVKLLDCWRSLSRELGNLIFNRACNRGIYEPKVPREITVLIFDELRAGVSFQIIIRVPTLSSAPVSVLPGKLSKNGKNDTDTNGIGMGHRLTLKMYMDFVAILVLPPFSCLMKTCLGCRRIIVRFQRLQWQSDINTISYLLACFVRMKLRSPKPLPCLTLLNA